MSKTHVSRTFGVECKVCLSESHGGSKVTKPIFNNSRSAIGRALPLQARGSGIKTLCFHFLIKNTMLVMNVSFFFHINRLSCACESLIVEAKE